MKSHSTKILILIVICNITVLAGYYLLFQYIKTQSKASLALSSTIDLGQQKNSRLSSLRAVIKDTDEKRQRLEEFLLSSDATIPFVEQVETLGKASGLEVKTNNISSGVGEADTAKTFKIQLETAGSWSNVIYFLSQIENLPYNVRVLGFFVNRQIAAGKVGGSSWVATFDISVTERTQHE